MGKTCVCSKDILAGQDVEIQKLFRSYSRGEQDALIPILQETQGIYGYLPKNILFIASEYLRIPIGKVYGVATFYNQFRLKPTGKYLIQVCAGTACHVRGGDLILQALASELGIKPGETTQDGSFTLCTVACLGACSMAPVVTIGDDFHGRLQPKQVVKLLKEYENK